MKTKLVYAVSFRQVWISEGDSVSTRTKIDDDNDDSDDNDDDDKSRNTHIKSKGTPHLNARFLWTQKRKHQKMY